MKQWSIAPVRVLSIFVAAVALASLAVLVAACGSAPTQESPSGAAASAAVAGQAQAPNSDTPKQTEAMEPVASVNGCVTCHTSSENVKKSAAPPAPEAKSAEQSGEG